MSSLPDDLVFGIQYKADAAKYMEAESKASARCHSLEEQILQLKAKLKDVKTMVKTVESKGAAPVPNQSLQKERDQLFVSRILAALDGRV
jgi:hypothetical protein